MRKASLRSARRIHNAPQRPNRVVIPVLAAVLLCAFASGGWGQSSEICRVGFTYRAFGELNENDAMAAVKAWTQAFMAERKIPATLEPSVYRNLSDMKTALTEKAVEALNMTTDEFSQLRGLLAEDVIVYGVASDSIDEEYVLLVNRNSMIEKLVDLKGGNLGLLSSIRASLAETWLDTILLREGLAPARDFFGRIDTDPKVDNLLIPLFFEKLDACVITRSGFDLMVELNPQTGQRLEVLSTSPPLVPTVFCFRNGWNPPVREKMVEAIQRWHLSPAGRQSLMLFQIDSLKAQSIQGLDSALDLIDEHRKLENKYGLRPSETATAALPEKRP